MKGGKRDPIKHSYIQTSFAKCNSAVYGINWGRVVGCLNSLLDVKGLKQKFRYKPMDEKQQLNTQAADHSFGRLRKSIVVCMRAVISFFFLTRPVC